MKLQQETDFLRESNAIEGVYDEESFKQAWVAWKWLKEQKELSIDAILKTHKLLMLRQPLMPNEKGYFRTVPVYIGGHEALNHEEIRRHLEWLIEGINNNLVDWKTAHVIYEKIHPFVDGNGRTGRMFMNWQRLRDGLAIRVIRESEKYDYYEWFR